jgi:LacI family kdg operon repressor
VAGRTGVSVSTVSNYLNGKYEKMSFDTRLRIEAAIAELNYTPNISARRLSAKEKCGVVCLIVPAAVADSICSPCHATAIGAVRRAASAAGYSLLIYMRGGKGPAEEIAYLKGMYGTIADCFLLFEHGDSGDYPRHFEEAGIPYTRVEEDAAEKAFSALLKLIAKPEKKPRSQRIHVEMEDAKRGL